MSAIVKTNVDPPGELRPYQWEGVHFLASRDAALLADEMGLGKTVQTAVAITINKYLYKRILLVAPASLCLNWQRELQRWAPNLVARRLMGDAQDRAATYRLPIRVLIASYEQIRSDAQDFDSAITFDLVILDEAQRIKNSGSETSLASRFIRRARAWALSGTPLENRPADLVSIFRFLKPGLLHKGMSRQEIHGRIADHFLRRTKREVLQDLPPIITQDLPLELGNRQRQAYDALWTSRLNLVRGKDGKISSASMLAVLTRLKQICNFDLESGDSTKVDALKIILDSIDKAYAKMLIFSQYVETLNWVSKRIDISHAIFHGGLTEEARERVISEFRQCKGPRALLISLKAGGVGLNLQEATTVILFDRWWNPSIENQAVQRAHRFGKETPLQVIRFMVIDSIEERIGKILAEKENLFDEYVESARSAFVPAASEEQLRQILGI